MTLTPRVSALLLTAVLLAMLGMTWLTWPDPVVDFGRELYVPWQITDGAVLYRDIAYHNGPLSPYVNAAWMAFAGVRLHSVLVLNFFVVIGTLVLLVRLLGEIAGSVAATLGGVTFLVLSAFGRFLRIGNYNWMAPYSHEITHGIGLALLSLFFIDRFGRRGRRLDLAVAGIALGLVFLTKAEVFVAAAAASGLHLVLYLSAEAPSRRDALRHAGLWAASALAPALLTVFLLAMAMPFEEALRGTLGTWSYIFDGANLRQIYFARISGMDAAGPNALRLVYVFGGWLALLLPPALLALAWRREGRTRYAVAAAMALWGLGGVFVALPRDWLRPLPLALLLLFLAVLRGWWIERGDAVTRRRLALFAAFLAFGGLMLLKVVLNTQVIHYGFGLAMIGIAGWVAALIGVVPRLVERRGGAGMIFAGAVVGIWISILVIHGDIGRRNANQQNVYVGTGTDVWRVDQRGTLVNAAVKRLEQMPANATLTCFVDCEILNFLTRRRNPIRYGNFNPQQIAMFGEEAILAELESSPPDLVAIVHSQASEYGVSFFGTDYGLKLWRFIERNYTLAGPPLGAMPMREPRFGIALYQHRTKENAHDANPTR
jgi:hypothetical protein